MREPSNARPAEVIELLIASVMALQSHAIWTLNRSGQDRPA
jgi:hypothetical protein